MKSKHSRDDYLYCGADHTAKLVQEQWVYTVNHDGKWAEVEEEEGSNKVQAVSFYPRTELVEPLEWKAPENRLKPSSIEPPKLELKELPKHLEYAFLHHQPNVPVSQAEIPLFPVRIMIKTEIVRMTKVIKGEFEKIKDVKVEDVSLTCDTPFDVFNNEVSRLSGMDDDLFTYEVEVANISCHSKIDDDSEHEADDDMGYDPSDVVFTEWLGSKIFNYKTMDLYTMKALWIYWIRGDDEVELTDEESSDNMGEVAEVFRIDTNLFDFETPMCKAFKEFNYLLQIDPDLLTMYIEGFKTYEDYKDDWIYEWNKDVPWVDEKPWTNVRVWTIPTPVKHTCKPFNYKTGCSEWPTCSWMDDGYCNGGNLPETYIIGNQLHYQDYEWYEALEDGKLKDEAL
ncbi:hypothetical protein Tco_0115965 [Tanacetum coccineum]